MSVMTKKEMERENCIDLKEMITREKEQIFNKRKKLIMNNDIDDLKIFEILGLRPKIYNRWYFAKSIFGIGMKNYPGWLFGQVALNLLYFYTRQGETVTDLMAGGGTFHHQLFVQIFAGILSDL